MNSKDTTSYCQEVNFSATSLAWPKTESGKTASQACPSGYTGNIVRTCNNGTWGDEDRTSCSQIIYCSADAGWPKTRAGYTTEMQCLNGNGVRSRTCSTSGTWENENTESCVDLIVEDIDYKKPKNVVCETVQKNVSAGMTIIIIHVKYSFYYKLCIDKNVNEKIEGIYDFTFTANTNSIAEDYDKIKDTIPTKVFESIKTSVDKINSNHDCKIYQGDLEYKYPDKLQVFKNDEYLIVVSNYNKDIETYSYDYPYNYINNSIVTIQSKTSQTIEPTENILYKMWAYTNKYNTEDVCKDSDLNIWGNIISYVYTNKYITFCLILDTMLRNTNVILTSLGDCKATFTFVNGMTSATFILSKEPYCKGVYLLTDMKDSITNFCKVVNTQNGKGWTYTIDLNTAYQSTPTVYNLASKKDIAVFNTGSNLLNDEKYRYITNNVNKYIPSIHCNQIKY